MLFTDAHCTMGWDNEKAAAPLRFGDKNNFLYGSEEIAGNDGI